MIRQLVIPVLLVVLSCGLTRGEINFLNSIQRSFRGPSGVDVAPGGDVYVADTLNEVIKQLDREGTQLRQFSVRSPRDVTVSPALIRNPNGSSTRPVFVVDRDNHLIHRFSETGAFQVRWGGLGSNPGQFNRPLGLDVNLAGDVFVADAENHRIQRFNINGVFQSSFGSMGAGTRQFNAPTDVAIGPLGEIFVADRNNNRVQKFDNDGNFEFAIGGFDDPTGLSISESGHLYVVDRDNHRIQRFGLEGSLQRSFGQQGNGPLDFRMPLDVAVSPSGLVYVADTENNRVQRYFDSDAWVRGRNEFTRLATSPINVGVGSQSFFTNETIARVSLGQSYTLNKLMELVVGANTRIVADGTLRLNGGELTTNTLTVEGIFVFDSGRLAIGGHGISLGDDGPFGDALRVGLDSSVSLGDDLVVGASRNARVTVERGGVVENVDGRIAAAANTIANVLVEGFGSRWSNTGELVVGERARGGLQVANGGRITSASGTLGRTPESFGRVALTGFDSRWTNAGTLRVAEAGRGELSVADGAQLSNTSTTIAVAALSEGTVVVTGQGSQWSNSAGLSVGAAGDGGLAVEAGAMVTAGSVSLGVAVSGEGDLLVSGFGSQLISSGPLKVGEAGRGRLIVADGAVVESQNATIGGMTGLGEAALHGSNPRWDVRGSLAVGSRTANAAGGNLTVGDTADMLVDTSFTVSNLGRVDIQGGLHVVQDSTVESAGLLEVGGELRTRNLTVAAGGQLRADGATITVGDRLANAGQLTLAGHIAPEITAQRVQNSGLVVGGTKLNARLENEATGEWRLGVGQQLSVSGTGNLNRGRLSFANSEVDFSGTLENFASGVVAGRGTLRAGGAGTTNRGQMIFSGGQTDVHGSFLNTGSTAQVLSTGGGTTTFFGNVRNQGGNLRVGEGSSMVFLGTFNGGTTGPGTAVVEGVLTPGNSPAAVTFEGDLIMTDDATTVFELGGRLAGSQYDQILGKQTITLSGLAAVETINDYQGPSRGRIVDYTLVSADAGLVGVYDSLTYNGRAVPQPTGNGSLQTHFGRGLFRTVAYADRSLMLTDYLALPGDVDGNRQVDFADFLVLSNNFGQLGDWLRGDFDGNGRVEFADYLMLSENFGRSASAAAASIPEPSSLALSGVLGLLVLCFRRK